MNLRPSSVTLPTEMTRQWFDADSEVTVFVADRQRPAAHQQEVN